ncbi:hypothetical protein U9M48_002836, partial [Paspalum notatum var. saurae]
MASSSSTLVLAAPLALPVTEKLTRTNFNLWKAQVMPAIRGAQLEGLLDGSDPAPPKTINVEVDGKIVKKPNEEYSRWIVKDQQVLSYLLASISKEILTQVADKTTAAEIWKGIQEMLVSQTRARTVNTRIALATTTKGNMTMSEYFSKMKSLADDMAASGKPIEEELVSYILTGLDYEYDSVVSAVLARVEPITVSELYMQLTSFDGRIDLRQGRGNFRGREGNRGGTIGDRNPGRGHGAAGPGGKSNNAAGRPAKPICQVCNKKGHTAVDCWHRYDPDYVAANRSAAVATNNYGVDSNWYTDSGATDHITGELRKLAIHDVYHGNDHIKTANGAGMIINHIGQAIVHTPSHNLHLNNVLHVPDASKNLISVHRLATDNNAYLEFHPDFFLIKDQATKRTLLRGRCRGGLYPLPSNQHGSFKCQVLGAIKPSTDRWHKRLGQPSFSIVHRLISQNKLPVSSQNNVETVCDACQKAKSHQLPYPVSTSKSSAPLELIFSDVWGPAPDSFGRKNYYVSFIDDFSKFTWIYLLKHKSEVFQRFHEFQQLVERMFDRKIISVQSDWGGEYEKLNSFFRQVGIMHFVSCPHAHQQNGAAERKHRHIVEVGLALLSHAAGDITVSYPVIDNHTDATNPSPSFAEISNDHIDNAGSAAISLNPVSPTAPDFTNADHSVLTPAARGRHEEPAEISTTTAAGVETSTAAGNPRTSSSAPPPSEAGIADQSVGSDQPAVSRPTTRAQSGIHKPK